MNFGSNAQDTAWVRVSSTPFMFSRSPFHGHSDCDNGITMGGCPAPFMEHIVTDSVYISNDARFVKMACRFFGNYDQVDQNNLSNYTQIDSATYTPEQFKRLAVRRVGDSLFLFNFDTENPVSEIRTKEIELRKATGNKSNSCFNNFPFGDCPLTFQHPQTIDGKLLPECYKVSKFRTIKNTATTFWVTLPVENISIGAGRADLTIPEYVKTWDSSRNLFFKTQTGNFNYKTKTWVLKYDTNAFNTKGDLQIYNGGSDTLFITECYSSAANAVIMNFSRTIPPASWGYFQLNTINGDPPFKPQNKNVVLHIRSTNPDKKFDVYSIKYRVE
ncbi:MAG: hypothetical protein GC181_08950 [Bacteroidetes bacterium]|nr:hypothetical protein [Bacteroidota bacterium]